MTRRSSSIQSGSVGYGTTSNCDSDSIETSDKGNIGVDENDFIEDNIVQDDAEDTTVMAVYDYDGACGESSIPISSGEYLVIQEQDIDGWTKVKRKFFSGDPRLPSEGFVPTAYLQFVWCYNRNKLNINQLSPEYCLNTLYLVLSSSITADYRARIDMTDLYMDWDTANYIYYSRLDW